MNVAKDVRERKFPDCDTVAVLQYGTVEVWHWFSKALLKYGSVAVPLLQCRCSSVFSAIDTVPINPKSNPAVAWNFSA